ncbi:hypothetical protein WMY93_034153, partial [Mugilogobius chulae]
SRREPRDPETEATSQQTLPAPAPAPDSSLHPPPALLTHLSIITVHMDPRASVVLLLLLCAAFCTAAVPQDCCLSVAQQRLPANRIQSYKVQEAWKGCDISATVILSREANGCACLTQRDFRGCRRS